MGHRIIWELLPPLEKQLCTPLGAKLISRISKSEEVKISSGINIILLRV
jgi:hypothetical protein